MNRQRRILFNTFTAISLLLAIATAGLWVRSYRIWDYFLPTDGDAPRLVLSSGRGQCYFIFSRLDGNGATWFAQSLAANVNAQPMDYEALSFGFGGGPEGYSLRLPHWLIVGTLCGLAALFTWRQKARPIDEHLCPNCGYDMRANPARCSECGHSVANPSCQ